MKPGPLPLSSRMLLRLHPRSWRERYGDEVRALLEDGGTSAGVLLDLARGCLAAWARTIVRRPFVQDFGAIAAVWIVALGPGALVAWAIRRWLPTDIGFDWIGMFASVPVMVRLVAVHRRNARLSTDWHLPGPVCLGPRETWIWRAVAFTSVCLTLASDRSLAAWSAGLPLVRLLFTPAVLAFMMVDQLAHRPWFLAGRGFFRPKPNVPSHPLGLS